MNGWFSPCVGRSGKPLRAFVSRAEAEAFLPTVELRYGRHSSYECERCGRWHIRPGEHREDCPQCAGRDGISKRSYSTRQSAERQAQVVGERGVFVAPYECPWGHGWHLSKS